MNTSNNYNSEEILNQMRYGKTKFCVKLLQALNLSKQSPYRVSEIGVGWCKDGRHFVCNTNILSKYLQIKPNSINANFRDHSFEIIKSQNEFIVREFGILPDIHKWKKRRHSRFQFNANTTEDEAGQIPCVGSDKLSESNYNSHFYKNPIFPPNLLELGNNISFSEIETIMNHVKMSDKWKFKFLETVTNEFLAICNKDSFTIQTDDLILFIFEINKFNGITNEKTSAINKALEFFFQNSNGLSSQAFPEFDIISVIKVCLRFGFLHDIISVFSELVVKSSKINYNNGFVPWFLPSVDANFAFNAMIKSNMKWILKMSDSTPNGFTIMKLSTQTPNGFETSTILFNALWNDNLDFNQNSPNTPFHNIEERYSEAKHKKFLLDNGYTSNSFIEILNNELNFQIPNDENNGFLLLPQFKRNVSVTELRSENIRLEDSNANSDYQNNTTSIHNIFSIESDFSQDYLGSQAFDSSQGFNGLEVPLI